MSAAGAETDRRETGFWWWPRRRGVVLDVALGLASAVECAAQGVGFAQRSGLPASLLTVAGAVLGAALVVRRRWPLAVILLGIAVLPAQMGSMLVVVGLYTLAAAEAPRRIVAPLACMVGVGTAIVTHLIMEQDMAYSQQGLPGWFTVFVAVLFGTVSAVPPVLLGMYVRARRRLVESLRDRADGLERELSLLADRAEERAEWARGEERTRIAREMHDVVAHRVSLMVVHAAALQAVAPKDPEKAAKNAVLIGDMGRQALTELRTMLGVLRTEDKKAPGVAAPVGQDTPARLVALASSAGAALTEKPGPRLGEVVALVEQSRAAGMPVELSVEGEARTYPARVESTAYRVIQEGLTNVHKHASGAATRVWLAHREGEVAVLVRNDAPASGGVGPGAGLPSGGNGLVGMRERVTALGGGFVSGPTEDGGFRVSAVLPNRG